MCNPSPRFNVTLFGFIQAKCVYTAQYFVGLAFCTLPLSPLMVRGGGEHGETEGIRFRYDESEIGRDNPPFHFPPLHKGGCLVGIPSLHKGAGVRWVRWRAPFSCFLGEKRGSDLAEQRSARTRSSFRQIFRKSLAPFFRRKNGVKRTIRVPFPVCNRINIAETRPRVRRIFRRKSG